MSRRLNTDWRARQMSRTKKVKLGVVGVDSGQLVICDPCYIDGQWDKEDQDFHNPTKNFSYAKCANITLTKDHNEENNGQLFFEMGHAGVGVVFSSGLGDGVYDVFGYVKKLKDWGERIVKVEIILIEEESDRHKKLTKHLLGR